MDEVWPSYIRQEFRQLNRKRVTSVGAIEIGEILLLLRAECGNFYQNTHGMVLGLVGNMGRKKYLTGCCHVLLSLLLVGCAAQHISGRAVLPVPAINQLSGSTNPYLHEESASVVDWYPWGKEVLEEAQRAQKLLAIDIGTSACYACRLQDQIVYRDSLVTEYMDRRYLSVRIDRLERPDIAKRYLSLISSMGQGGWPLQIIALPDGRPLVVGNFLSPERWLLELKKQDAFWRGNRIQAERLASENWQAIRRLQTPPVASGRSPEISLLRQRLTSSLARSGPNSSESPRFPLMVPYQALLAASGDSEMEMTETYLTSVSNGSIYDHVGGGLMRCAEDPEWKYPCFEKTLYDNAQFLSLLAHQYSLNPDRRKSELMYETREFLLREMRAQGGGFSAAMYPDSEGELGRYYLWPEIEVRAALGANAGPYIRTFNITRNGNWGNGQNVLFRTLSDRELAAGYGMNETEWDGYLFEQKRNMLSARSARVMPKRDPLWMVGWHGLLVKSFVEAYHATGDESWLWYGVEIADQIRSQATEDDGALDHYLLNGVGGSEAFLSDYAYVLEAYFYLYQATLDGVWLNEANSLIRYLLAYHLLPQEGWFVSAPIEQRDWLRQYDLYDTSLPSGQATLGLQLFRYSWILEKPAYRDLARKMLRSMGHEMVNHPVSTASWTLLASEFARQPCVVSLYHPDGKKWINSVNPNLTSRVYLRMSPEGTRDLSDPSAVVSIRLGLGQKISFDSYEEAESYLIQISR